MPLHDSSKGNMNLIHKSIELVTLSNNDHDWTRFVTGFPNANIFHSSEMNEVLSLSNGFEPIPLFAFHGGEVVACAFPVIVESDLPLPGKMRRRLILYGSPLAVNSDLGVQGLKLLVDRISQISKRSALFAEIRNSDSYDNGFLEAFNKWEYCPRENYLVDLTLGENELLSRLSSGTRKNTRRAKLHGCTVRELEEPEEFDEAVSLIQKLYSNKNVPMVDLSVFYRAQEKLSSKKLLRAIAVVNENRIIGARFTLNYADTVYDWYAASDMSYSKHYPNEALVWDTISWGCRNGYKIFDFGGGGVPGKYYGPAVFKEKFKGEKVEYGRYRWTSHPTTLRVMESLYEMRIKAAARKKGR